VVRQLHNRGVRRRIVAVVRRGELDAVRRKVGVRANQMPLASFGRLLTNGRMSREDAVDGLMEALLVA